MEVFWKVTTRESVPQNIGSWEEAFAVERRSYERNM